MSISSRRSGSIDLDKGQMDLLKDMDVQQCIDMKGNVIIEGETISMQMSICRKDEDNWEFNGEQRLGEDEDPIKFNATVNVRDM